MDARFEDAEDRPLRLHALDAEDLSVVSALVQDAVATAKDLAWLRKKRRFALFLNRFRWEDADAARRAGRPFERVRTALLVEHAVNVRASGIDPADKEQTVSVLGLAFDASPEAEDPSGKLRVLLAGDGEIEITVEFLEVRAEDVTRPWISPSGKAPSHPGA
ncbi:MAG: DUF2948 family protein [Pseudomonadota bacterium]